ncbi:MAG: hypothetical protein WBR10_05320 [Candidatus Acidiferrum sp.]
MWILVPPGEVDNELAVLARSRFSVVPAATLRFSRAQDPGTESPGSGIVQPIIPIQEYRHVGS